MKKFHGCMYVLIFFTAFFLFSPEVSGAINDKNRQVVYNNLTIEGARFDTLARNIYGKKYWIVNTSRQDGFTSAKLISGRFPEKISSKMKDKDIMRGQVVVFYLITDTGRTADPVIIMSDNRKLNDYTLTMIKSWKFKPPQFRGKPVWSTASQTLFLEVKKNN